MTANAVLQHGGRLQKNKSQKKIDFLTSANFNIYPFRCCVVWRGWAENKLVGLIFLVCVSFDGLSLS